MKRALLLLAFAAIAACADDAPGALSGYVEADTLYIASEEPGRIVEVMAREGDRVEKGAALFRLDAARLSYSLEQSEAQAVAAQRRVADKGALDQAVAEAEAERERARLAYERSLSLKRDGYVSQARVDNDRAAFEAAEARVARARAERDAAAADVAAMDAQAGLARQRLSDLVTVAPAAGSIERIYRRAGEVVAAGDPVLSLLPPGSVKIRFFAPQRLLSSLSVGGTIHYSCDGCAGERAATISYIATEPQFTPPVIYSIKERDKLVFLVEARPEDPEGLRPGLPVDVRPK
ncbi:MAG: HlyD family efflux transporter periplasmic adaptor subunit [Pseudomonadota bacterium]|nr:HlyD family efflux transporter periplasmic adaptor subunit [Pseudomonadota bacterium]